MTGVVALGAGRQASYEVVAGGGDPLLWFEGGPGFNAHLGRPDVELLAGRVTGYLIDAPGAGGSTPPADERGYGARETALFYDEVRRALGLGPVAVAGHSWGASVALLYAALFPHACTRCVAVSPFANSRVDRSEHAIGEHEAALDRHRHKEWFTEASAAFASYGDPDVDDPARARERFAPAWPLYFAEPAAPGASAHVRRLTQEFTLDPGAARAAMRFAYDEADLEPVLPGVACPALILAGEFDIVCGPAHARAIAAAVPRGSLHVFGGCGHIPQYEAPAAFREVVLGWWDECSPAT